MIKDTKNQEPIFTMSQGLSLQRQEDNRSTVIIRSRRSLNTRILRIKPNNTTETERSQGEDTTLTTQDAIENFVMPSSGRMETEQTKSLQSGNKKESITCENWEGGGREGNPSRPAARVSKKRAQDRIRNGTCRRNEWMTSWMNGRDGHDLGQPCHLNGEMVCVCLPQGGKVIVTCGLVH